MPKQGGTASPMLRKRGEMLGKENRDSNASAANSGTSRHTKHSSKGGSKAKAAEETVPASPRLIKPIKEIVDQTSLEYMKKKPYKHYGEIEGQLWKNNITFETRKKRDFLDVTGEDFSQYETTDIMGNKATPSTFNIFRDSLRKNKETIH